MTRGDNASAGARASALARARAHAPFLARMADDFPDDVERFLAEGADAALALCAEPDADDMDVVRALRRWRGRTALLIALGDLAGEHDVVETTRRLTDFADRAVDHALAAALAERGGEGALSGFAVIALGKMGSHELNYSSDIDPILIFDPETLPHRAKDDPGEAAVRIARRMMTLLGDRTADGHVLRVDLRLRPSPEVTPIALPVEAAISYYESQALPWEQAAFIRSRAAAGDFGLGRRFLGAIEPFIWRRALDFRQIKDIGAVSARIRDHYAQGQAFGPGFDLKRGRGGIREIEFYAQVHQLIYGGRDPALRAPATLDALAALGAAGRIDADVAARLADHYRLFRRIEHRLQMIDDQQTHLLPHSADALDRVARLDGLDDGGALIDLLAPAVADVGAVYDTLIDSARDAGRWPQSEAGLRSALAEIGFDDADAAVARIAAWRSGQARVLRSAAAQEGLEAMLPAFMTALAQAEDPVSALNDFDRMIAGLPSAINFFHLLAARPGMATLLTRILMHAPTLADALATRADLIDGLIDPAVRACEADTDGLIADLATATNGRSYEAVLDLVRAMVGERRFALGVRIVEGDADPVAVGRSYGCLAEAALVVLADATVAEFRAAHGVVPGSELVILALGRFGGGTLTHASDLDLIYLFTGDHLAESDGARPLGATHYYNRLAQRVTAAMSVPTAAGRLYEVDTRLRPSGAQGPLVVSLDSFARYQRDEAWTWEHMALTRARPVYGSAAARAALGALIDEILNARRDTSKLVADAAEMREKMAAHKPPTGPLDVKNAPGGLVDLEFAIHVAQLSHRTAFVPALDVALAQLVDDGLADRALVGDEALLTRLLVVLRLVAPDGDPQSDGKRALIARACGLPEWAALIAATTAAEQRISAWWAQSVASGKG